MADEEPKAAKKVKKTAVPEKPAAPKQPLPKASEIRAAKKAELVAWSDRYELSTEGKVDDLRKRLFGFVAKEEAKAAREAEKAEAPEEKKKPAEKEEPEEEKPLRKKPKKPKEKEEAEERVHEARANPNWTTASSNSWRCVPRRTPLGRSSGAKNGSGTACSETNGGSRREANRSCGATSATDGISRRLGTAGRGRSEACTQADSRRSSCTTRGSSRASMQRNRRCGLRTVSAPGSGRSSRRPVTTRACAS